MDQKASRSGYANPVLNSAVGNPSSTAKGGVSLIYVAVALFIFATVATQDGSSVSSISKIVMIAVFILNAISGRRLQFNALHGAMAIFVFYSLLSVYWSVAPDMTIARWVNFAVQLMVYVSYTNFAYWRPCLVQFSLKIFLLASLLSGFFVIGINGVRFGEARSVEGFVSSGQLAISASISILIAGYFYVKSKRFSYLLTIVPLIAILALTSGRRGFLLLVVFVPMFLWLSARRADSRIGALLLGSAAVVGAYFAVMKNQFLYSALGVRLESFITSVTMGTAGDASVQGRTWLIDFGYSNFLQAPYIGNGLDTFTSMFGSLHGAWHTNADNNYIQLLSDLGIIGFLLYYVPLAIYIARRLPGIATKTLEYRFAITLLLSICALDFASVRIFSPVVMFVVVLTFTMIAIAESQSQRNLGVDGNRNFRGRES